MIYAFFQESDDYKNMMHCFIAESSAAQGTDLFY